MQLWALFFALTAFFGSFVSTAPSSSKFKLDGKMQVVSAGEANFFSYASSVTATDHYVNGFKVTVFGLEKLSPLNDGQGRPITTVFYMHGRFMSVATEADNIRTLYSSIHQHMDQYPSWVEHDLLVVAFDALNHGERTTDPSRQLDLDKNPTFLMDQYDILIDNRDTVTRLINELQSSLFPTGNRQLARWVAAGHSMGAHSVWHVLAHDSRVTTGIALLGMSNYNNLMHQRASMYNVELKPPVMTKKYWEYINQTDPGMTLYNSYDSGKNPFLGKHILQCNGGSDNIVPQWLSRPMLDNLVLGPTENALTAQSLELYVNPGTDHLMTPAMFDLAGSWVYRWEISRRHDHTVHAEGDIPAFTMSRPSN